MEFPELLSQLFCIGIAVTLIIFFAFPVGRWLIRISLGHTVNETDDHQELCTRCEYDVRGLKRCTECGTETRAGRRNALLKLRNEWPTESLKPRIPDPGETPVVILSSKEEMAVRLLRQHLHARGIRAKSSRVRDPRSGLRNSGVMYRLTAWSDDRERAEAIVNHLWPEEAR